MAMAWRLDQDGAIRALEASGIGPAEAVSIVKTIHDFLVIPAAENMVTKAAERSARSRLRTKIEAGLEQIADIATRVTRLDDRIARLENDVAEIRDRMIRFEDRAAKVENEVIGLKESIKGLRDLMVWGIGSSTAFLGILIAVVGLVK